MCKNLHKLEKEGREGAIFPSCYFLHTIKRNNNVFHTKKVKEMCF